MPYSSQNIFGIIAVVISALAFVPYIRAIVKGQTKPSGPSWWAWTFLTAVIVVSSWSAGASWQVLILPIWLCLSQFSVALLSLHYGDNNWDFLNRAYIIGAFLSIVLWFITGKPIIALILSIVADVFASFPTFRHTWKDPRKEDRTAWTLGWFSAIFEILAIHRWSFAEASWAIYFLLMMSGMLFLVWRSYFVKLNKNIVKKHVDYLF